MSLINPNDTLERQNEKLLAISRALMRKVEQKTEQSGIAYAQFERAALLEVQVQERTIDLERTLDLLQESNAQLERANRETETARENLTEAIETINEGFALFDPDDQLVLFNSRFCRDLRDVATTLRAGLSFGDYVDLISNSRFLSLPEGTQRAEWARRRTDRHRDDHVVFNVALSHDRWLQVSEHRTARGGTVILQTDVTAIIRLERQERDRMRDQQSRILQATLDHLNQGVCIFDADLNLVGWNRRIDRLLDLPPQAMAVGRGFGVLLERLRDQLTFSESFDAERLIGWANYVEGRPPIAFEVTRAGQQTLSIFGQEMPDRGFVISFTDVTAERMAAKALSDVNVMLEARVDDRTRELGDALSEAERANASKSRFFAAASHDLLQPLSAAKLFVSSLSDQLHQTEHLGVLDKAETALASVEQIIEALLDISKLDAAKPSFDIQSVSLRAILDPLRDELTPVAKAKGLDLQIVDCGLTVRSDAGYLRRVAQNLISNAVRYTDDGKIRVGVRRRGGVARLEIWDTGRGIAKEDQSSIFQEFKRLDQADAQLGLGLGLAIVERACKSLDHPLSLCSEQGRGSCFAVELPIVRDAAPTDYARPRRSGSETLVVPGLIVLLVENDAQLARAMSMMMERWGADVIYAQSADDALELLGDIDLRPDALLLDYQLGSGMNGAELYTQICDRYGDVPARLVSADRGNALRQTCAQLGLGQMTKPIDRKELLDFLNSVDR
ncbi:PAS-domain containing protein [Sulfitobacter sp. S190]|uniref:hybrid sensor histidine kinase/response regulator n=1 Tax=Sulfitobacter sp. S190 TaxID=2867022 RepID=UPI0021A652AF|nr:PAS-domain containing protein [Sulfitobacter sp. S190]UWR21889.1 PAS-domain containing protein [Sulfitobacter sp. S190]